ncbi:MAG: LytR/AlgR family response regulator transcription factor [bacterium]
MRILVVDDEQLARHRLIALLKELGEPYEVVAEAENGDDALVLADQQQVDVVLLDIQMPGISGLEVARKLTTQPLPPAVIFTTAYEEHALTAFESNAVGYLVKPIRSEKLLHSLQQASQLTRPQKSASQVDSPGITVQMRGNLQRIPLTEIYYLHADNKYVMVRHTGGEALLEESLVSLEQRFGDQFLRVHRNALVCPKKLSGLSKNAEGQAVVQFLDIEDQLPVSRRHLAEVRRQLKT